MTAPNRTKNFKIERSISEISRETTLLTRGRKHKRNKQERVIIAAPWSRRSHLGSVADGALCFPRGRITGRFPLVWRLFSRAGAPRGRCSGSGFKSALLAAYRRLGMALQ